MKILLSLTLLSLVTVSCDAPVRTRVPTSVSYDSVAGQTVTDDTQNTTVTTTTTTGTTESTGSEPGYDNCDLSLQYSGGTLGYFGMCRSANDERQFKAVFAQSSTSGTCFIPVNIQSDGTSYKLGIAQCVYNQANQAYYMTLNKEMMPPTFTYPRPEAINGVMVISSSSVNAYMGCMNAKEDYYVATYGCCYQSVPYNGRTYCLQPNPQCETAANTYANNVCTSFKQNHSNNYRQVSF